MKEKRSPVAADPEILGGIPVFRGTRVPIKTLFDFLEAGRTTEYFLQQFPTVKKTQVRDVLKLAETTLTQLRSNENSSRRVPA